MGRASLHGRPSCYGNDLNARGMTVETIQLCAMNRFVWSTILTPLPRAAVYHPNQTLNDEFYISGESYTGLCLDILQYIHN